MRFTTVLLVAMVVAGVLVIAFRDHESYANYHDCAEQRGCNTMRGSARKECIAPCKSGGWKTAGGSSKRRSARQDDGGGDDGGDDSGDDGGGGDRSEWKKARITCYTGNQSSSGSKDFGSMVAVLEKDKDAYMGKTLRVRWPDKGIETDLVVGDYCADKDCDGCCTNNAKYGGFLLDVHEKAVPGGRSDAKCWAEGEFKVVG